MTTIRLYGEMGAKFGRRHEVLLTRKTPQDAIKWLVSQFPKIKQYFYNATERGVDFAVFRGKENICEEQFDEPSGDRDIRIAPIMRGNKNIGSILQVVVGAAMIVVGAIGEPFSAGTSSALVATGIAMVAGGVIQLLTPLPKMGQDGTDNAPNYVFQGAVNTQAQGNPVPLLYGRMICGSAVISAAVKSESYVPSAGLTAGQIIDYFAGKGLSSPYIEIK